MSSFNTNSQDRPSGQEDRGRRQGSPLFATDCSPPRGVGRASGGGPGLSSELGHGTFSPSITTEDNNYTPTLNHSRVRWASTSRSDVYTDYGGSLNGAYKSSSSSQHGPQRASNSAFLNRPPLLVDPSDGTGYTSRPASSTQRLQHASRSSATAPLRQYYSAPSHPSQPPPELQTNMNTFASPPFCVLPHHPPVDGGLSVSSNMERPWNPDAGNVMAATAMYQSDGGESRWTNNAGRQPYPGLNHVTEYSVASLSPMFQLPGLSTVSAEFSRSPVTPNMLSPYSEAYPTSLYPASPASLSPSGISAKYQPSLGYSSDMFTQTPLNGAAAVTHPQPYHDFHWQSPSSSSGHHTIAPRPPVEDGVGSLLPVPSSSFEPGTIHMTCLWRHCTAPIITAQGPNEMKQRVRLHFKHQRHTDDYVLHNSMCQWAGCICLCHRGTRCSTLGPDHPAHVKDIVHHVMKTHLSD